MYDIIIIGAGTAGLSAGIYGARAGKKVLILDSAFYGGQIVNSACVENYPGIGNVSGYDFVYGLFNQATEHGAEYRNETVIGINDNLGTKEVTTDSEKYLSKTVILAMGGYNKSLGVEREKMLIGKGISYCATCDGAFYKGKDVAVVGGGNTAFEDALVLSGYCNRVYLIHRRDSFRAEEAQIEKAKNTENISIITDSKVVRLLGTDKLRGVVIENVKTGKESDISLDGLFVAIGVSPSSDLVKGLVNIDEYGYIEAGEECKTNVPGIFVAGDIRTKTVRQLVTAAADGAVAALGAAAYCDEM